jgi:hypothetical protein
MHTVLDNAVHARDEEFHAPSLLSFLRALMAHAIDVGEYLQQAWG